MYLKAIEIQGFKSFPEKTRLTFEKSITAIVGPNGSGKSNISDAIMWVTGEQSSKALRGTKMEDVIFGGTEKRPAYGCAQVSLIFDNSSRILDFDSDEVVLSRKYYRDGESEYSVNREPVRLKDIHSLLMDTGLGRDGYSIIGQGKIADILSTKSTDRREVFEEAAGIARFRYRKNDAEGKLGKAEENLLRINDKIDELNLQVEPLREQAEVAKKFLLLRDELRVREISVWMEQLDKLKLKSGEIDREYNAAVAEVENAKADLEALYASAENLTERMKRKEDEAEQARERLSGIQKTISEHEADCAVVKAEIKSNREKTESFINDIQEQEQHTEEIKENIASNKAKTEEIDARLEKLEAEKKKNANVLEGCRMKIASREKNIALLKEAADELLNKINAVNSKIAVLTELEKEYEGYSKAVRFVMRESQKKVLSGIFGPVAELLTVDNEYALAIETALGAASQHIVVDTQKTGRNAIEMLKRTDSGRATFLPVDTVRAAETVEVPDDDPGFVGIASELISFDDKFYDIFTDLLGRTVVAETLSDAIRISNKLGNKTKIVSLDGQLVNVGGSLTGGSVSKNTGMLSRKNELASLNAELKKLQASMEKSNSALEAAQSEYDEIKYRLQIALEDSASLNGEENAANAERGAVLVAINQFESLLEAIAGSSEARRKAIEECEQKETELRLYLSEREAELDGLRAKEKDVKDEIASFGDNRSELEEKRSKAEKDAQSLNVKIISLEKNASRIEQKKQSSQMEEKQLLDKLWENYELSHSAASAVRQPVESIAKSSREIAQLKAEMSELGNPNLGAIDEYARVSERYGFLTSQRDDVLKAKAELKGIISDITDQMTDIFRERFKQIDTEFRNIFTELFRGGKAALVLEDENNILECGIDIKVQPPGKALSTISLLSGGEMAFVAIALYFAIIKVRPTPFCVMDEIEAALDEENVNRFADYLKKMSDKTQFLVITHRRGTMEEAEMLYGVTMQEKGVSKVISLSLDNVDSFREKKI